MADILLNVDGEQKVFKNTVHLAANTESGGKAVYTEESETTTAYLLTDPTGEMPMFEGGVVRSTSSDESIMFAAMNGSETAADGVVAYEDNKNFYFYSATEKDLTNAEMNKLMGAVPPESDADSVVLHMYAGWTFANGLSIKPMTTSEMQADLRKRGGIALDTFDLSAMDAYLAGMLVRSEIAVAKYAQADWAQGDPTKPDYVNNRIGGFFLPKLSVDTIEWDGEAGNKLQILNDDSTFIQVYKGNIYKEHFYGAKITITTKVGDAAPTTDEGTLDQSIVDQKFQDIDYMYMYPEVGLVINSRDVSFLDINLEAGLYLSKITSTSTSDDVTTTTVKYISKIEFAQQSEPVIVPISKMWLPSDLSGGDIKIATSSKVGGVKNPSSYTESSDDVTAYVRSSDGLIKVPTNSLAQKFLRVDGTFQLLGDSQKDMVLFSLGINDIRSQVERKLDAPSVSAGKVGCVLAKTDTGTEWVQKREHKKIEVDRLVAVQQAVRMGIAPLLFNIGDQVVCNHNIYGELVWDIIGFDCDTPTDSTYTHSMAIQLRNCIDKKFEFDAGNSNNWKNSDIRRWLNSDGAAGEWWTSLDSGDAEPSYASTDGFLKGLDNEFKNVIGTVTKHTKTFLRNNVTEVNDTPDKMWLPSRQELFAADSDDGPSGITYPYYKKNSQHSEFNSGNDVCREKTVVSGTSTTWVNWWTRTIDSNDSTLEFSVNISGAVDQTFSAVGKYYIAPVCCIV